MTRSQPMAELFAALFAFNHLATLLRRTRRLA
jgi:hypothetical protein